VCSLRHNVCVNSLRIDPRGDLASVKIASSLWSDSISLASQGTSSTIDILDAPAPGRVTRLFQLVLILTDRLIPFDRHHRILTLYAVALV